MIEANGGHLYERAEPAGRSPVWHLDGSRTFFAGPLDYNAPHQHGAAVFLAGLYGRFRLRVAGGDWLSCRTAMIPAGVVHELDLGGDPLAVFYIEPHVGGAETFAPIVGAAREIGGALVGDGGEYATMRAIFESTGTGSVVPVLDDLLAFAKGRAPAPDERLARALDLMHRCGETLVPATAARCAAAAGLSPSRFQHLFSAQMKVPFRRYRAWTRMRRAIDAIVAGSNFTTAAHTAGFADQAHFAHDFRRTFGAPASRSLTGVRR